MGPAAHERGYGRGKMRPELLELGDGQVNPNGRVAGVGRVRTVEVGAAEEDAKECGSGRGGVGIFLMEESGSEEGGIEAGLRLFDQEAKTGGQGEGRGEGESDDDGGGRGDGVESREFSVNGSQEGLCCLG